MLTQIGLVDIDKTGYSITLEDTFADYPSDMDIERVVVGLKYYYGSNFTENHVRAKVLPTDLIYPPLDNILTGVPFSINSTTLGITTTDSPTKPFCDGVYDVWYSVILSDTYEGNGERGQNVIFTENSGQYLDFDVIYSNGKVYRIDKFKDTISGQVLWLLDYLEDDIAEFQVGYLDIIKIFMDKQALSKTVLATGISAKCNGEYRRDVLEAQAYLQSANDAITQGDYETAQNFIDYTNLITDRLVSCI